MAHFAKIGLNSRVCDVLVVADNDCLDENNNFSEDKGIDFLLKLTGYPFWKQCSYNTSGGVHEQGGTPIRKNYPSITWRYDEDRDAFLPSTKPFSSWTLNEETCLFDPPTPYPNDGAYYTWSEENIQWEQVAPKPE